MSKALGVSHFDGVTKAKPFLRRFGKLGRYLYQEASQTHCLGLLRVLIHLALSMAVEFVLMLKIHVVMLLLALEVEQVVLLLV